MENEFEMLIDGIRHHDGKCPLSEEEMRRMVVKSIDTARLRRWGWVPHTVGVAVAAAVLSTSFYAYGQQMGGTVYAINTHNMPPALVVQTINEMLSRV